MYMGLMHDVIMSDRDHIPEVRHHPRGLLLDPAVLNKHAI